MMPLIERKLPDGRSVADVLFSPVDRTGIRLEFVDVGARNGSFILPPSYATRSCITGFEPNPAEYQKLVEGRTDSILAGANEPPFKERRYFPSAVWSADSERDLYVTVGPGAVSVTGPVNESMVANMFRANDRGQSYLDRHQRLLRTEKVKCVALDGIWPRSTIVDILKLDVEGGELEVLKGAERLLSERRVLLIQSEFLFVPYYEPRVTLGHQQVYLDALGYRLIALKGDHTRYCWHQSAVHPENDRWMSYAGDAIFVIDPDRHPLGPEISYRMGLACLAMGFGAFGLNLIRQSGLVPETEIRMIESEANRVPLLRRLRDAWVRMPDAGYRLLHALGVK